MAFFTQQPQQGFSPSVNRSPTRGWGDIFFGKPEQNYQQSLLGNEQQGLYQQLLNAGMGEGAGGAYGTAADYYRDLLSEDPMAMQAFAAPELRRFREQTVPGLAEQFAGFGSGGLSSSGFRNAAVSAGTDLSERLGAIRANLRAQGAQGLMGIGQQALGRFTENVHRPETYGLAGGLAQGLGQGLGAAAGSYLPGGISAGLGWMNPKKPAVPNTTG
jgi:hypothetical protein